MRRPKKLHNGKLCKLDRNFFSKDKIAILIWCEGDKKGGALYGRT